MDAANVADRLDAIEKQLDEVLLLLRHNMKKPPSGEPKIHDWPDDDEIDKWNQELAEDDPTV